MSLPYIVATIHILTLGIGFYGCWTRARELKGLHDVSGLNEVFKADNLWGIAALLWITTGLWRAFGGLEKGSDYYLHNYAFLLKMFFFLLVFIIEIRPMVTLIRWRIKKKRNEPIDLSIAITLSRLTYIQLGLLFIIVALAVAMARGMGF